MRRDIQDPRLRAIFFLQPFKFHSSVARAKPTSSTFPFLAARSDSDETHNLSVTSRDIPLEMKFHQGSIIHVRCPCIF
ncbi:unnamed protein product, partial [Mycena citricolor]